MLRKNNARRRVVIAIKTTGDNPDKGDRMTEIACVEMKGLETTGNNFQTFLFPGRKLMNKCEREYKNSPSLKADTAAQYTIHAMKRAQALPPFTDDDIDIIENEGVPAYMINAMYKGFEFSKIEDVFMEYLREHPDTTIITHDIGRLKKFLRNEMSEEYWNEFAEKYHDPKHGMMQKARKFRQAGLFPDTDGVWSKGLGFDAISTFFDVPVKGRTYYSAMQDALMMSQIVRHRKEIKMENIECFPTSKSYPVAEMDTESDEEVQSSRMRR